nr:flagellar hook-basal body complex protein [bacterium]
MMRSLYAGISGLRNFQTKMDIIGNNIANVNTIAFKSSRITFAETMAQTLSGEIAPTEGQGGINSVQVGLGMRTLGIDTNFSQGSMESTGVKTDLAIQGDGFFMVTSNDKVNYTRAGAFQIDAEGNLVTAGSGHKLMGYMSDTIGNQINRSSPKSIQIPLGSQSKARSTTEVTLAGNLDMNMTNSFAALIESGATGITNVAGTAKDGLGGVHTITVSGTDATQSSGSFGTELNPYDTLNSLGVATTEGFSISIDGRPGVLITGLTSQSRLDELVKSINSQVDGVTAVLSEGAITVSRDYHGIGESNDIDVHTYFFEITDREGIEGTGISQAIFGGTSILVNNGTSGNLSVVDSFVPKGELDANATQFELVVARSDRTGLATGIKEFGDGGVQVSAPEGL